MSKNTESEMAGESAAGSVKDPRKNTSLRLRSDTLKALKLQALEHNARVQAIMDRSIDEVLGAAVTKSTP